MVCFQPNIVAVSCVVFAALGLTSHPPRNHEREPADSYATVRGMTISCHGMGRVWGSDEMVHTMGELKRLGVNWVTIHPYAGIRDDGTVGQTRLDGIYRDPSWLTRPIREARRLGLKIAIKPHIAYWGSRFSWRGAIAFETDAQWNRFFDTYESWLVRLAEICKQADAFVVGTELDGTIRFEQRWRRIIKSVRKRTDAPLTYSANWDAFERVGFWDALDVIGIQAYFPLVDHENVPTRRELDDSWTRLIERLTTFGTRHNRRIVLGELGYNHSSAAAVRPWEYRQGGEQAEEVQRHCLASALAAIERSDVVTGAFLWKWFPGQTRRGNFLMSTPSMRKVIGSHWSRFAAP